MTFIEARPFATGRDRSIFTALRQCLRALATWYCQVRRNARQRRDLKQMHGMSAHVLRDIGIDQPELASIVYHCRPGWERGHAGS